MKRFAVVLLLLSAEGLCQLAVPTSVDSRLVLDAAGMAQRSAIHSVFLVVCPNDNSAGTGFLLKQGVLVTNAHVVGSCDKTTLYAISPANKRFGFKEVHTDKNRDLAVLKPLEPLKGGLRISVSQDPVPGTLVSTWGYPLLYTGTTPLLSVGYVAGYRVTGEDASPVKHIVVNGAFNHGNSGGPLFKSQSTDVIGVVVLTFHFYPPQVRQIIDSLAKNPNGIILGRVTDPQGNVVPISESQVTSMVLDEFYNKTQVVIGEAVSGSELTLFLNELGIRTSAPKIRRK